MNHATPEPTSAELAAFVDRISAPTRAAEAAVPLGRTDEWDRSGGAGWTITKDGVTITLTQFEMRRLVMRVRAIQNVEDRHDMGRTSLEDDPEVLALVRVRG